jgi:hypothetical protein
MGKDDRQAFLVEKEDHHHHHIISAENKQSLTYSLFAWNLFHGSTAKFCFVGSVLPTCNGFFTTGFIILKTFFFLLLTCFCSKVPA